MAQSQTDAAARQASCISALLCNALTPASVLLLGADGGCLEAAWSDAGVGRLERLDLSDREAGDVASQFAGINRVDIAHCTGLVHGVPTGSACVLVNALALRADFVVFSLSGLGAGGTPADRRDVQLWRDIFAAHGYAAFDCLRPAMAPKLRGDLFLFANLEGQLRMGEALRATALNPGRPVAHGGGLGARFRHYIARLAKPRRARRLAA